MNKRLTILLTMVAFMLTAVYFLLPEWSAKVLVDINRKSAGLSEKAVVVDSHNIRYLAGGRGETVILLHGIFAEKDHWVDFVRVLDGAYAIVAPDLPGFGASGRFEDQRYDYAAQVERMKSFVDALGIERAHFAGNSMGGTIAALFAIRYPERVASLAFIGAPHGVKTATRSEMDFAIDGGKTSPLIARNTEEFEQMLTLLFHERPFLPYPIARIAREGAMRDASSNARIWNEQLKDRFLLDSKIEAVSQPTLVLWGEHDKLFDVTGAAVLRQRLQKSEVRVMRDVGHLPMLEAARESATAYAKFLSRQRLRAD